MADSEVWDSNEDRITIKFKAGWAVYSDGTTARCDEDGTWTAQGPSAEQVIALLGKWSIDVKAQNEGECST